MWRQLVEGHGTRAGLNTPQELNRGLMFEPDFNPTLPWLHSDWCSSSFLLLREWERVQKRCISHLQCNQRLGRIVMILQPGSVHHTCKKKSLSGFKHYILIEILNISYQILLFNLRNNLLLLLWDLGTWVVSENGFSWLSGWGNCSSNCFQGENVHMRSLTRKGFSYIY